MTWSYIAVKKPSISKKKSAFFGHLFDASMSTYCWLRSYGWRPCKAFWDLWLLTLLLYTSSVGSSFAFARTKSCGVHLSSAFTIAAWRDDVTYLFKQYVWSSFTCLSRCPVISINPLPPICRGRVSISFAARGWWNLYLVSNVLILVWRFSKSVGVHFTIPKLKVSTAVA